jgi:hypothetical protein
MGKQLSLKQTIEGASSPDEIRDAVFLFRGKTNHALVEVAQTARVWDDGLLLSILASGAGSYQILANPHLPEWAFLRIARWELNRLHSEAANDPLNQAHSILSDLARRGKLPSASAEYQELLDIVMVPEKKRLASFAKRQEMALRVLAINPEMDGATLERLVERTEGVVSTQQLIPVVCAAACPTELRRRIFRDLFNWNQVGYDEIHALAQADAVRLDPEIRPAFLQRALEQRAFRLYAQFAKDAQPGDCREVFQRIVRQDIAGAVHLLEQHGERIAPLLQHDDLLPLLNADRQEVRLAAIRVSGLVPGVAPVGLGAEPQHAEYATAAPRL